VLALAAVAGALPAQARAPKPTPASLREELQRTQALHERLVGLRIRYDLGLPVQADQYFALAEEERGRSREVAEAQLGEEQARVSGLGMRLAAAQAKLAAAKETIARAVASGAQPPAAAVPVPAAAPAAEPAPDAPFLLGEDDAPEQRARPAAAARDQPPPVLLRGSEDHARVGRALFLAAQHARARAELEVAVKEGGAPVDLFYLARSCEALGDHARADELYLQLEVKDTGVDEEGQPLPGPWARAARVARRQMQWMRDNGPWQPARPLEAVQWRNR
jgi:hypothetical protein